MSCSATASHRHHWARGLAFVSAALVWLCVLPTTLLGQQPGAGAATEADAAADGVSAGVIRDQGFVRAGPGREIVLPVDHGSHPETQIEWWYLTGPLSGPNGELFGFQATWFRRALAAEVPEGRSPLAARDVILFHGALTDMASGTMVFFESASRAYPTWAGADPHKLDVHLFDQQLTDESGTGDGATLSIDLGDAQLQLDLDLSASATLRHGAEPGLSVKGEQPGQASWYYSLPTVAVRGQLSRRGQPAMEVQGRAWLDHEFGAGPLGEDQVGWDWFATVLDDGTELMAYQLRRADGSAATSSSLSVRREGGELLHVDHDGFAITPTETWTSPHSGAVYPSAWLLEVFDPPLTLKVSTNVADQELITESTGVTYWEGLCRFEGQHGEREVRGHGYVELVGYAGSVADRFGARAEPEQQHTKR